MTVFKRPGSKFYQMKFVINGVSIRESTKCSRKADALKVEERRKQEIVRGTKLGEKPPISLKKACEMYLGRMVDMSEENLKRDQSRMEGMFRKDPKDPNRPTFNPDMPFHMLTVDIIDQYITGRKAQGRAANTIWNELNILRSAIKHLKKVVQVPAIEWPTEREDKRLKRKKKSRALTADEMNQLVAHLEKRYVDRKKSRERDFKRHGSEVMGSDSRFVLEAEDALALVLVMMDTGMRPGEIYTLLWADIDLEKSELRGLRHKVDQNMALLISSRLHALLKVRFERDGANPYVFPARSPKAKKPHMSRCTAIGKALDDIGANSPEKVERYGCRATMYTLRDTFATRLLQSRQVNIVEVQQMLGHSDVKTTQKYASMVPTETARKAAQVVENLNQTQGVTSLF